MKKRVSAGGDTPARGGREKLHDFWLVYQEARRNIPKTDPKTSELRGSGSAELQQRKEDP